MLAWALLLATSVSAASVAVAPAPCGADITSLDDLEGCQRKALDDAAVDYAKANGGSLPAEGLLTLWRKAQTKETKAFRAGHKDLLVAQERAARDEAAAKKAEALNAKRLTVYVAPWCPHCREATSTIVALKGWLAERGVEMRVVVGGDSQAKCEDYAKSFGDAAVIDAAGSSMPNGVPHFSVTKGDGTVLNELAGFPPDANAPQLAAALNLP